MRDALATLLAGRAALVFARDAAAVADLRMAARENTVVLLIVSETVPKLDAAMLLAALGPLAADFAPNTRIVALEIAAGAAADDVLAAADFLAGAASTTGQMLRVTPRRGLG